MRCSRNFSHNCVNASSWAWRKRVFFQNGDSERWSFCRACRVMASRVMSGLVTRTIFHIEGMDNMYSNPITYWTYLQLSFCWGGCFFVVGLVGSKLPQTKMHRWIGCLMDLLVSIPGYFQTCFVFFLGLGFLIWRHQALYWWCFFSSNGVILDTWFLYVWWLRVLLALWRLGQHRIESWTFCRILAHFLACLELRTPSDSSRKQWDAWKCGTDITSKREPVLSMENTLK